MSRTERHLDRTVVLGAAGFMGINLAHMLVAGGVRPVLVDRVRSEFWPDGADTLVTDLSAPVAELVEAMRGAVVFHLASATRPSNSTAGAAEEVVANVASTIGLLETTRDCACRWVFASSGGTVYGEALVAAIAEDHSTMPISSYGVAKLAVEKYLHLYRSMHGTDYVVARISNPFGPFQPTTTGQGLIATLFSRIAGRRTIEIWGDGENVRDYVYVDDLSDALAAIALGGRAGRTYNVGSGTGTSINALVPAISRLLQVPAAVIHRPPRPIDVRRNVLDIGRIRRELGWRPRHTLADGLAMTHAWFERVRRADCERPPP